MCLRDFGAFRLARLLALLLTCLPTTRFNGQNLILSLAAVFNRLVLAEASFNDCSRMLIFCLFGRPLLLLRFLNYLVREAKHVDWYLARFVSSFGLQCDFSLGRSCGQLALLRRDLLQLELGHRLCFYCRGVSRATGTDLRFDLRIFYLLFLLFPLFCHRLIADPIRVLFKVTDICNFLVLFLTSILIRLLLCFTICICLFVESLDEEVDALLISFRGLFLSLWNHRILSNLGNWFILLGALRLRLV